LEDENKQWYNNKELFEQIIGLQQEMRETRTIIKKYNSLYDKVNDSTRRIDQIESRKKANKEFSEGIIQWGGWLFGLITLVVLLLSLIN